MWVRSRARLIDALDITPEYLRTKHGDAGTVIDFRNWHLSLGRRFRSLKLWIVLRSYGISGFQEYIRRVRLAFWSFYYALQLTACGDAVHFAQRRLCESC